MKLDINIENKTIEILEGTTSQEFYDLIQELRKLGGYSVKPYVGATQSQHYVSTQPNTDYMSFNCAFDFYRRRGGRGKTFRWRGKEYTTFTKEEAETQANEILDEYKQQLKSVGEEMFKALITGQELIIKIQL